jgi:hypothetical protein
VILWEFVSALVSIPQEIGEELLVMPIRLVVLELRGEVDQTDDREENQRIEYHRNKAMVLDQRKELKELEEAMGEKEMAQDRREELKELKT